MQLTINFLNQHRKKLSSIEANDRKYYRIIMSVAIGIVLLGSGLLAGNIFLQYRMSESLEQKNRLESAILKQEDLEESALILSSKLQVISKLIAKRSDKQEAIRYFTELFGSDVMIKDIDFQSTGGILSLRLESQSVFAFNRVVDLLESETTLGRFKNLSKSDLSRSKTGTYSLTVTVTLVAKETAT